MMESVGMMKFPTEWKNKKCSKPPIRTNKKSKIYFLVDGAIGIFCQKPRVFCEKIHENSMKLRWFISICPMKIVILGIFNRLEEPATTTSVGWCLNRHNRNPSEPFKIPIFPIFRIHRIPVGDTRSRFFRTQKGWNDGTVVKSYLNRD